MGAKPKGSPRQLALGSGPNYLDKAEEEAEDNTHIPLALGLMSGPCARLPLIAKALSGCGWRVKADDIRFASDHGINAPDVIAGIMKGVPTVELVFLNWVALPLLERNQYLSQAIHIIHTSFGRSNTPMGLPHFIGRPTAHPEKTRGPGRNFLCSAAVQGCP